MKTIDNKYYTSNKQLDNRQQIINIIQVIKLNKNNNDKVIIQIITLTKNK